jgi:hypothetical protein
VLCPSASLSVTPGSEGTHSNFDNTEDIKIFIEGMRCDGVSLVHLLQHGVQWWQLKSCRHCTQ